MQLLPVSDHCTEYIEHDALPFFLGSGGNRREMLGIGVIGYRLEGPYYRYQFIRVDVLTICLLVVISDDHSAYSNSILISHFQV